MSRATIVVVVGLGYFGICAAIAVWAARRTRTAGDFFLAGRGVGIVTLAIAAMAATLSGFAFVGGPGLVYARGIGAVYIVLPAAITGSLVAWVLARRLRLLGEIRGLVTVPEAVGARYRSRTAQRIAAVAILLGTVCYIAANFLALGLVIDAIFATGVTAGVWIGAAVVVAYSATGGMLAGMYTDLFQGLLMAAASLLVFGAVLASGDGMASISREILAGEAAWFGPWGTGTPLAALSFFFVFGLGTLGQPQVLHKFYMLRDPRQMRWYPLLMTGALMITLLLFIGVGMAVKARVLSGDLPPLANADEATPTFLLRYTPVMLAAVVFSGVAAAIMSTVNSFLNLAAAAITRDLTSVQHSDSGQLRIGRLATVVVALLAVGLAVRSGALIALLGVVGWGVFAATLVPSLAFGLAWRGATRAGAIASMLTGLLVTVVLEVLVWLDRSALPVGVSAAGIALLAAMLVFLGVSWLTRAQAAGELDADVAMIMER